LETIGITSQLDHLTTGWRNGEYCRCVAWVTDDGDAVEHLDEGCGLFTKAAQIVGSALDFKGAQ
jgi:hypothetical protein